MGNIVTTLFPTGKGSHCITTINQLGHLLKGACTCEEFSQCGDCLHVKKMKLDTESLVGNGNNTGQKIRELNG